MTFWRIDHPDYHSDYKHIYVNGSLVHPFGLPGVKCDVCGQTWGGIRILPHECPQKFRRRKNLKERWPISRAEHAALQESLMKELDLEGEPFADLRPGDDFQPCFLDVPSLPRDDFLWPSLGSLVVSERIKNLLLENCSVDIIVCPVSLRRIGNRESKLPPPIPSTGEPEDMIDEMQLARDRSQVSPYFEVLVQGKSGFPPGGEPVSVCPGCKRPSFDSATRRLRMTDKMWNGRHIFFLATTLYVIVTDELREKLERLGPTNVIFKEI